MLGLITLHNCSYVFCYWNIQTCNNIQKSTYMIFVTLKQQDALIFLDLFLH